MGLRICIIFSLKFIGGAALAGVSFTPYGIGSRPLW
jgi:hypothetical protein